MCNYFTDAVDICGISTDHIIIMRNNRAGTKEYPKRIENQSHPDMKVPTPTCTNFEELDLDFTSAVRRNNSIFGTPLDDLLSPDTVGNDNVALNIREENLFFCQPARKGLQ